MQVSCVLSSGELVLVGPFLKVKHVLRKIVDPCDTFPSPVVLVGVSAEGSKDCVRPEQGSYQLSRHC